MCMRPMAGHTVLLSTWTRGQICRQTNVRGCRLLWPHLHVSGVTGKPQASQVACASDIMQKMVTCQVRPLNRVLSQQAVAGGSSELFTSQCAERVRCAIPSSLTGSVPAGVPPCSLLARQRARVPSAAARAGQKAVTTAAEPRNAAARTPTLSAGGGFAVSRSVLPRGVDIARSRWREDCKNCVACFSRPMPLKAAPGSYS